MVRAAVTRPAVNDSRCRSSSRCASARSPAPGASRCRSGRTARVKTGTSAGSTIGRPMSTNRAPGLNALALIVRSSTIPTATSATPAGSRHRLTGCSIVISRIAAMGATRAALAAGTSAATTLAPTPTTTPSPTVTGGSTRPKSGSPKIVVIADENSRAPTTPTIVPTIDPVTPMTSASPTTVAITWRRDAPREKSTP